MLLHCHAAKGGVGTTVFAAIASLAARRPALLVDLAGDVAEVLGHVDDRDRPGVVDWLASDTGPAELDPLVVEVDHHGLSLLPSSARSRRPAVDVVEPLRWTTLAEWLREWCAAHDGIVVIDGGTRPSRTPLSDACDTRLLVTRSCYLALRAARRCAVEPTGVVLVDEPGHALNARDVARATGAPAICTVTWDPSVARAVDAGLLNAPPPRAISHAIERSIRRLVSPIAA